MLIILSLIALAVVSLAYMLRSDSFNPRVSTYDLKRYCVTPEFKNK